MSIELAKPVISGFNPDPSICRVGEHFYVVCSSFEYFPGVPLYRSEDLQSWTHIGNVLYRLDQLDVRRAQASQGVYAATIRHHGGRFWMITTNVSAPKAQLLVHAETAKGPWSKAVTIPGIVKGHEFLPGGGREICPVTVTRTAR